MLWSRRGRWQDGRRKKEQKRKELRILLIKERRKRKRYWEEERRKEKRREREKHGLASVLRYRRRRRSGFGLASWDSIDPYTRHLRTIITIILGTYSEKEIHKGNARRIKQSVVVSSFKTVTWGNNLPTSSEHTSAGFTKPGHGAGSSQKNSWGFPHQMSNVKCQAQRARTPARPKSLAPSPS